MSFSKMVMAGNVYSTYELAKQNAVERQKEIEQDIFICRVQYKSGEEFVLRTRKEMMSCGDYLYVLKLPFNHHFALKQNAEREADRFASERGKPVYVKKKTVEENGYSMLKYYHLTHIEPCSILAQ